MKKTAIIALILFLGAYFIGYSQIRFGIEGRPQICWFKSDIKEVTNEKVKVGLEYGLTIDIGLSTNYFVTTGIYINNSSAKLKYSIGDSIIFNHDDSLLLAPDVIITHKLQYIHIPLALKFKTNEIGMMTYWAEVGINPQVNIKAVGTATDRNINDEKMNKDIRFFNMAYHISAGFEFSFGGKTALLVGLTFNNGFTDITDVVNKLKKEIDDKVILNNLYLRLGILF